MLLGVYQLFITIFVCIIYNEFIFNLKLHCDTMIEIYALLMYLEGTYGNKMVFRYLAAYCSSILNVVFHRL